jgi:hypothetical protein
MRRCLAMLLVCLATGLAGMNCAWALRFSSSFSNIMVTARPGQTLTNAFQMTLADGEPTTHFRSHVEDFWRSEDGSQSFYRPPGTPGNPSRSCAAWVEVNPVEAAVKGGEVLTVRVTVTVPADAHPGGYWCVLTVDELPDPLAAPEGVGIQFRTSVSTGIFVGLQPLDPHARILAIDTRPDRIDVKLRNEGNCPLHVSGRFEFLKPGGGEPIAVAPIEAAFVLPEPVNTRILSAPLPDVTALPSGAYLVRAVLDIGLDYYLGVQREMVIARDHAPTAAP